MTNAAAVPRRCEVLVIGGGPGGSYTAAALALEGLHVVLLEAEMFPRYHIGESMLPAMRHLLRFIDADSAFDAFGFTKKVGAAFKLSANNREGYTDFLAAGGSGNYSWNVVRADADLLLFQHAAKCGATVFDGIKVMDVSFKDNGNPLSARPIQATYERKSDGLNGTIAFDYVVDASGRAGLLSARYFKSRTYNDDLKNVATWSYWSETRRTVNGTDRENTPYFEALTDGSGWAWFIPLHIGVSVGVVINQDVAAQKKRGRSLPLSANEFYMDQLRLAPTLFAMIGDGKQFTRADGHPDLRSASDYSYTSDFYALPGVRLVGDAGSFIDPLFSSGVHLAVTSGLSAALTICAAVRGDCSEDDAARWHSEKMKGSFSWFLMVVLGTYQQIRAQDEPILSEVDEDNFDRAFEYLRPVIQGSVDVYNLLSKQEISKTVDRWMSSWESKQPDLRDSLVKKISKNIALGVASLTLDDVDETTSCDACLTAEEQRLLAYLKSRRLLRTEDIMNIRNFSLDVVRGRKPRLQRGQLGLEKA